MSQYTPDIRAKFYELEKTVNDSHFQLMVACTRVYAAMTTNLPLDRELDTLMLDIRELVDALDRLVDFVADNLRNAP